MIKKIILVLLLGIVVTLLVVVGYRLTQLFSKVPVSTISIGNSNEIKFPIIEPSGKCGYELFYAKNGQSPEHIEKDFKLSNFKDEDIGTLVVYTDGCPNGTSTPFYYYKGGGELSTKEDDAFGGGEVKEISRGTTFEEASSFIFSNPIAKLMDCHLQSRSVSAQRLLTDRRIFYEATSDFSPTLLTDNQKKRIRENGGQIETLHLDDTTTNDLTDVYIPTSEIFEARPEHDCGDGMNIYTYFLESIDVPNVIVRLYGGSQSMSPWTSGGIKIVR